MKLHLQNSRNGAQKQLRFINFTNYDCIITHYVIEVNNFLANFGNFGIINKRAGVSYGILPTVY